jgi:quercetin dioxygenase-like cupin family protein
MRAMRWPQRTGLLAGALVLALAGIAAAAPAVLTALSTQTPAELRFVADPAHEGYETAVTAGDPSKPGVYAVQTRLPANTTILPHTHGEKWRVGTVLSGTLHYAQGETFDEKKLKTLPPGSVIVEPQGVVHFARTGNEPVLLNIVGEGPASTVLFKK